MNIPYLLIGNAVAIACAFVSGSCWVVLWHSKPDAWSRVFAAIGWVFPGCFSLAVWAYDVVAWLHK